MILASSQVELLVKLSVARCKDSPKLLVRQLAG